MEDGEASQEEWIKIVSEEGYVFLVKRKIAEVSPILKDMLGAGFSEAHSKTCDLKETRAPVVEKLIEYLAYKKQYENAGPREEIPEFTERIPPEIALELLLAGHYFEV